jgi:photosystem II stability/assembly factor-like uncharacterized protein
MDFDIENQTVYAAASEGVFASTDQGVSWFNLSPDFNSGTIALERTSAGFFVGTTTDGVYKSTDNGLSWAQANHGIAATWTVSVQVLGGNLFSGVLSRGPFRSSDAGESWDEAATGLGPFSTVYSFVERGDYIFSAAVPYSVNRSSDDGETWERVDNGLSGIVWFKALAAQEPYVFAGASGNQQGLFRSSDNGDNWEECDSGLVKRYVNVLGSNSSFVFAGTNDGLYRSDDQGNSWELPGAGLPANFVVNGIAVQGTTIFTSDGALYRSTDNGENWENVFSSGVWTSPVIVGSTVFVIGDGIWKSDDSGESWTSIDEGFASGPYGHDLTVDSTYLYAAIQGSGVWRRPLSEIVAKVEQNDGFPIPSTFSLSQNYPNPFNGISNFEFGILKLGDVSLKIYDLLGREVATVVDERLGPGTYTRQWDATGLASGVYLYRLTAGDFVQTRKLVLLR